MNVELRDYVKRLMRLGYTRKEAGAVIRFRALRDSVPSKGA